MAQSQGLSVQAGARLDRLPAGRFHRRILLMIAAGLFLRALDRGRHVDLGFETSNVAVAAFDLGMYGYDDAKGRLDGPPRRSPPCPHTAEPRVTLVPARTTHGVAAPARAAPTGPRRPDPWRTALPTKAFCPGADDRGARTMVSAVLRGEVVMDTNRRRARSVDVPLAVTALGTP